MEEDKVSETTGKRKSEKKNKKHTNKKKRLQKSSATNIKTDLFSKAVTLQKEANKMDCGKDTSATDPGKPGEVRD